MQMRRKRSMLHCIIAVGVALLLVFARHDICALVKFMRGQARIVNKTSTCDVWVNGALYRADLYEDTCRIYHPYPSEVQTNLPCLFVYARTPDNAIALRLGFDWMGLVASSRGKVEPIFNWMVISEIAENTYDLRDPEKGWGIEVVILGDNAELVYECREPGNPARELFRIAIPQRLLKRLE